MKILFLDYETSPQLGWFFGSKWETNIIKIEKHEQILTASLKWFDGKKIYTFGQDDFKDYKPGNINDKSLVEYITKEFINKADVLVAHNGDQFDHKVLTTRLSANNLALPSTTRTFDTKKIAKSKMHLPSNSLQDIADFYGIEGKFRHTGASMWFGCLAGNEKDWKMMKKYDKQDVVILEKIFHKLSPMIKQNNLFTRKNNVDLNCSNPACLSKSLKFHKKRLVVGGEVSQYQCQDCGSYTTDNKKNKNETTKVRVSKN